jgi:hypothetical protein
VSLIAFLDASVLYSATLRSVLMYLAAMGVFHAQWSDMVTAEWTSALARDRPDLPPSAIARTQALMEKYIDEPLVTGFEELISSLDLPDPDDRHVLAAAIHGGASAIVTLNLKHFPVKTLALYEMRPWHPDDFVLGLLGTEPDGVTAALAADRARLHKPPMTVNEYLLNLERSGLKQTAAVLRAFEDRL